MNEHPPVLSDPPVDETDGPQTSLMNLMIQDDVDDLIANWEADQLPLYYANVQDVHPRNLRSLVYKSAIPRVNRDRVQSGKASKKWTRKQIKSRKPDHPLVDNTVVVFRDEITPLQIISKDKIKEDEDKPLSSQQWPTKPYTGLVFEDGEPFYKDILLNEGLSNLHWDYVPSLLRSFENFEPVIKNNEQQQTHTNAKSMLRVCMQYNILKMREYEAENIRQLLVVSYGSFSMTAVWSQFVEPPQLPTHYKYAMSHYKYEKHPLVRIPNFPDTAFQCKETRTQFLDPIVQNFVNNMPNALCDLVGMLQYSSKTLNIGKIKAILKSCLRCGTDPLQVIKDKCWIWNESYFINVRDSHLDPLQKQWPRNLKRDRLQDLTWMISFIPPHMLFYEIAIDDDKTGNIFLRHKRFFVQFRQMLIQLRNNILEFCRQYIEIANMSPSERERYRLDTKDSFESIMRTPHIQYMFMCGNTKNEVTDYIYQANSYKLRKAVLNTASRELVTYKKRVNNQKMRNNARLDKQFLNDINCYHDTCQNKTSFWAPATKNVANATLVSVIVAFTCFLVSKCVSPVCDVFLNWYTTMWVNENVVVPVQRHIQAIGSIVTEVGSFCTSQEELSQPTQLVLVEIVATINIIYNLIIGDYENAASHVSYFVITRANQIKGLITIIPELVERAPPPEFPWFYNGEEYFLTLAQFEQVRAIYGTQHVLQRERQLEIFANSLVRDETQALGAPDWAAPVAKILSKLTAGELGDRDVRDANALFQYHNLHAKDMTDQCTVIKGIISLFGKVVFGCDPFDESYQSFAVRVYRIIDFVEANMQHQDVLQTKLELMQEVLGHMHIALDVAKDPNMSMMPHYLRSYYMIRFNILEKMTATCHSFMRGTHDRETPLFVLFTGPPGVGKTTTMKFVKDTLSGVLKVSKGPENVFTFNPDNEFFEGYAHQYYVMMDDMFKHKDLTKRAHEATTAINMINTVPFNMPMAFGLKGMMYFDSQIVFATTNIVPKTGLEKFVWEIGLTDSGAFERRIHLSLHKVTEFAENDPSTHLFTVERCKYFPEMIGKDIDRVEIVLLCLRIRKAMSNREKEAVYTDEQLQDIMVTPFQDLYEQYATATDVQRNTVQVGPADEGYVHSATEEEAKDDNLREALEELKLSESPKYRNPFLAGIMKKLNAPMPSTEFIMNACKARFSHRENQLWKIKVFALVFFLLALLSTTAAFYFFWKKDDVQAYSKVSRKLNKQRKNNLHAKSNVVKPMVMGKTKTQSGNDNYYNSLVFNVSRCIVKVYGAIVDDAGVIIGDATSCFGFHYDNGIFFFPAHFALPLIGDHDCKIRIVWMGGEVVVENPIMYSTEGQDCMFCKVTCVPSAPKSMRKYVWEAKDVVGLTQGTPMQLLSLNKGGAINIKNVSKAREMGELEYDDENGNTFRVDFDINYYEHTKNGESGSVVFIEGNQGQAKAIGFHVCLRENSTEKFGFALGFNREGLDGLIAQTPLGDTTQSTVIPFQTLYELERPHYPPRHSKIRRSPMYKWDGPPVYIPAHLAPFEINGVTIDPLLKSLDKLRDVHTPETEIHPATKSYLMHLYPRQDDNRLLTYDECIRGIPGTDILSINVGTSPGYPYNASGKKGKTAYIEVVDDQFTYEPKFLEEVQAYEEQLKRGEQIEVLWADFLKDETRPIAKVEQGKTRLVSACPLHFQILMKRYTGKLMAYIKSKAATKPILVGINPHSIDWTNIRKDLSRFKSVVAGDFENWDGSTPKFVALVAIEWINEWYNDGPENAKVRDLLFVHLYEAVHALFQYAYQTKGSHPTGNQITSEWNSILQIIEHFQVYVLDLKLRPEQFSMKVYGDDNANGIDLENMCCAKLAPYYWTRFKAIYTDANKTKEEIYHTLDTITLLGRFMHLDDKGIARAPLDPRIMVESIYWFKSSEAPELQLMSMADTFFLEMSHHPEPVFDDYCERFLAAFKRKLPKLYPSILARKKMYFQYYMEMYHKESRIKTQPGQNFDQLQARALKSFVETYADSVVNETDRAVKDPNQEGTDLGTIMDVAPEEVTSVDSQIVPKSIYTPNIEVNDFNKTLDRTYVTNVAWPTSAAAGAVLRDFYFPNDLFIQPYIADKIKNFNGFIGGVEISFRVTASRQLYGTIIAAAYPFTSYYPVGSGVLNTEVYPTSPYKMSGNPHVLCQASASDVVTMQIPFVSPFRYLDLRRFGGAEICQVRLSVLNPLTNTESTTASATVVCTYRFIEGKVMFPTDSTQSGKVSAYERIKNIEGAKKNLVVSKTNEVRNTGSSVLKNIKLVGNTMANCAISAAETALVGVMLGLDRPRTTNFAAIMTANPNYNSNYGNGIETMPVAALDSENRISTQPNIGGITADEMAISYFACTPAMSSISTWLPGSTPLALMTEGIDANTVFVDYLKLAHTCWSGSHKVKLYICASIFHAVRLVVYWAPTAASDYQSCLYHIIEVQGSTEVAFSIPYWNALPAHPTIYPSGRIYSLYCKVLAWSQPDDAIACPIYINCYKAGASDFKIYGPTDCASTVQNCPRAEFNEEFTPIHVSATGYDPQGVIYGEEIVTLRDLCHRLHPWQKFTNTVKPMMNLTPIAGTKYTGADMWANFYRFWHGGIRLKCMNLKANTTFGSIISSDILGFHLAGIGMDNPTMNSLECEFPYYSPVLFDSTDGVSVYARQWELIGGTNRYVLKGTGDDFSFHWLQLPRNSIVIAPLAGGGTVGYSGLQVFYT